MDVAMRRMLDEDTGEEGELEGIRIPLFNYTGKEVLAIKRYEKKIEEEIERVKNLTDGKTAGWIISSCQPNSLYLEDFISVIKGVGIKTKEKLETAGICQVRDLLSSNSSTETITSKFTSISNTAGISITTIRKYHNLAKDACPGSCPDDINYLAADNPYEVRYGERWREEIKKVRSMSKYCDICDLVRHIHGETRNTFKGTKHENTYLFYHDALITMTHKDCLA